MTFAEEIRNKPVEESSQYPTAYGITFSPTNIGIGLGILGIVGGIYIWMTLAAPAYDKYNQLKATEADKKAQVDLQKNAEYQNKLAQTKQELIQAQKLQGIAYSLFANEQASDTLLLDLNKLAKSRKVTISNFTPDNQSVVIADGSLGPLVNNKLKRKSFTLKVNGDFGQIHELMRDIERLQPLLLVKNFSATTKDQQSTFQGSFQNGKITYVPKNVPKLNSSFRLDLIFPISSEEMAKLNPPPSPQESPK